VSGILTIQTSGRGFVDITTQVAAVVADTGIQSGLCTVFVQHTSASLTVQENADPSARRDLEAWLERIAPEHDVHWTHVEEGPDDMPSHVRSMVTDVSLSIPVLEGALALGTWQGIFLCEHRRKPHARRIVVQVLSTDPH
jgi:secondary thiamine-phosphate synthase enzyme